jgi:hypothetical protein
MEARKARKREEISRILETIYRGTTDQDVIRQGIEKVIAQYGGSLYTRGPCSHGRDRGESWVRYGYSLPKSLLSKEAIQASKMFSEMLGKTRRVSSETFEKKVIEYKPYDMPNLKLLGAGEQNLGGRPLLGDEDLTE